uniref:Putative secreted protein n=1 Tax=Rhipicephalus microplus TaxID=6941 RepID=A0A6G5A483_RHIMP
MCPAIFPFFTVAIILTHCAVVTLSIYSISPCKTNSDLMKMHCFGFCRLVASSPGSASQFGPSQDKTPVEVSRVWLCHKEPRSYVSTPNNTHRRAPIHM